MAAGTWFTVRQPTPLTSVRPHSCAHRSILTCVGLAVESLTPNIWDCAVTQRARGKLRSSYGDTVVVEPSLEDIKPLLETAIDSETQSRRAIAHTRAEYIRDMAGRPSKADWSVLSVRHSSRPIHPPYTPFCPHARRDFPTLFAGVVA